MNDKDLREKSLFGLNDVFAEFLNAFYRPQNAPPILPEELADAPTEFVSDIRGGGLARKFRDVLKCLRSEIGINLAFFGLENQTKPDKSMPIRVMGYDWLVYDNQLKQKTGKQKLIPIVTFVLYFGYDKRWDAPRSLSECFDVPEALKPCFQDYSIRVIELAWLTDDQIERLSGDLKAIAVCLRKFRSGELAHWPDMEIAHVREVLDLLGDITGSSRFSDIKDDYASQRGSVKMCEMFEKYNAGLIAVGEERGKAEGIAIGEKRGEERGKFEGLREMTKRIMALMNKTPEDAMNYLRLTDDEKQLVRQAF